jgi:hypothetical protein
MLYLCIVLQNYSSYSYVKDEKDIVKSTLLDNILNNNSRSFGKKLRSLNWGAEISPP